jgi:hypothetical protein
MPVLAPLAATHGPSAAARKDVAAAARHTPSRTPDVSVRVWLQRAFWVACTTSSTFWLILSTHRASCLAWATSGTLCRLEPTASGQVSCLHVYRPPPPAYPLPLEDARLDAPDSAQFETWHVPTTQNRNCNLLLKGKVLSGHHGSVIQHH